MKLLTVLDIKKLAEEIQDDVEFWLDDMAPKDVIKHAVEDALNNHGISQEYDNVSPI